MADMKKSSFSPNSSRVSKLKPIRLGEVPKLGRYLHGSSGESMEKVSCRHNPSSDVLVTEREGGEVRDVACEFISRVDGFCSRIKDECIYYENMPKKKEEKKRHLERLGPEWIRYLEGKLGKGEEREKRWYAITADERANLKKQFIKEMEMKGLTVKDIFFLREYLNFWD